MTRCPEGHFYDPAKHTACPWCALPPDVGAAGQKTRPMRPEAPAPMPPPLPGPVAVPAPPPIAAPPLAGNVPPPISPPAPVAANVPANVPPNVQPNVQPRIAPQAFDQNATIRVGASALAGLRNEPVAGWLVCLEGPSRGKDYRLHTEKNFIGRGPNMDVILDSDNTVSRERHAVVIFDPKKKTFWALPGEASGLVYLNGDIVNSPAPMKADDVLEVGQTKLVLIPFLGDRYSWSNETTAPAED